MKVALKGLAMNQHVEASQLALTAIDQLREQIRLVNSQIVILSQMGIDTHLTLLETATFDHPYTRQIHAEVGVKLATIG